MTESGQLDLVALLSSHTDSAESALDALEGELNVQTDANRDDKLLMDMLDYVTDARNSLRAVRDALTTMTQRDLQEIR